MKVAAAGLVLAGLSVVILAMSRTVGWSWLLATEVDLPNESAPAAESRRAPEQAENRAGVEHEFLQSRRSVAATDPIEPPDRDAVDRRIRVVDDAGRPVGGAEVFWVDDSERIRRLRAQRRGQPEAASLPERLMAMAQRTVADAGGAATVPAAGQFLQVYVRARDLAGSRLFDLSRPDALLEVVARPGDTLFVRLLDEDDAAVPDTPVILRYPVADQGVRKHAYCDLGRSDDEGRLRYPGWRDLLDTVKAQAVDALAGIDVGPGFPGGAGAFRPAPIVAEQELTIRVQRPRLQVVSLLDAMGGELNWSGTVVTFGEGAMEPFGATTVDGRVRILVCPGRRYTWTHRAGSGVFGVGTVVVDADTESRIRCEDVAVVTGRFSGRSAGSTVRVEFVSRFRTVRSEPVQVGQDETFRVAVGRDELDGPLEFTSEGRRTLVRLPRVEGATYDLGVVQLRSHAFASVLCVDSLDRPVEGAVVGALRAADEEASPVEVRRVGPGSFEVFADRSASAIRLLCSAPGKADVQVQVEHNEDLVVTLATTVDARIRLDVGPRIPHAPLWVRLRQRLDPVTAEWDTFHGWARVDRIGGQLVATFRGVLPGNYEAVVMSALPVAVLAERWIEIRAGEDVALVVPGLRQLRLQVTGDAAVAGCYIAAGTVVEGELDLQLRHLDRGVFEGVVRAAEASLLIVGPGLRPQYVDATGLDVRIDLEPWDGVGLPGLSSDMRRMEPASATFRTDRWTIVSQPEAAGMQRDWGRMDELTAWGDGWVLPCDYHVRDPDGGRQLAVWRGRDWALK
ncbi:MAG: hypothetical protein AB7O97_13945 [Planctomycetota bacterium]